MYVDRLSILDAAELLRDRMDGIHGTEQLPTSVYNKRSSVKPILRAINRADIKISSIRKRSQIIALFIPKEVSVLPLNKHDVFEAERLEMIEKDQLQDRHPAGIEVFLNEQPWLELRSISTEIIPVFEQYPTMVSFDQRRTVRRADYGTYKRTASMDEADQTLLHYDTERRIVRLTRPFDINAMLVFEGTLMPARMDTRQISSNTLQEAYTEHLLSDMELLTPAVYEDVVMDTALQYLVPEVSEAPDDRVIEARLQRSEAGSGPTVVIPGGKYSEFGGY